MDNQKLSRWTNCRKCFCQLINFCDNIPSFCPYSCLRLCWLLLNVRTVFTLLVSLIWKENHFFLGECSLPGSNPRHGRAVGKEQSTVHPITTPSWPLDTSNGSIKVVSGAYRAPITLRRVTRIAQIRWERRRYRREWRPIGLGSG